MDPEIFDELLGEFLLESRERIERVEQGMLELSAGAADPRWLIEETQRELHTLKGNAGMMGLEELQHASHRLEDLVAEIDPLAPQVGPVLEGLDGCRALLRPLEADRQEAAKATRPSAEPADASVRVAAARLERLTRLMSEQVMVRQSLGEELAALRAAAPPRDDESAGRWRAVEDRWRQQEVLAEAVRDEVLALRMVPLRSVFGALRRLVHDEAAKHGKRVRFESRGESTPLDRTLVEAAAEALGHLARNAVVHGIEAPERRQQQGKPATGTVLVQAAIRGGRVLVEVIDDGAGIDGDALRSAARRAGLAVEPEGDELTSLLFHAGLSSRLEAGLEAGRGVGLATVRDVARRSGGDVEVASLPGLGSRFCVELPSSVSTREVMMVEADGERYALPVAPLLETVSASDIDPDSPMWRERPLRLVDLGTALAGARVAADRRYVAVLELEGTLRGLAVDRCGDLQELVVQDLDELAMRPGLAGTAALGDGSAVLVLDPHDLFTASTEGEPS